MNAAKNEGCISQDRKSFRIKGRTIVYNNSIRDISDHEYALLARGLNFSITPKKFPFMEYISSTESLCQKWEMEQSDEALSKTQKLRHIILKHLSSVSGRVQKRNLSINEEKVLRNLGKDKSIVICPADKGKAIVIEDRQNYIKKKYDQIKDGDYEPVERSESAIIGEMQSLIKDQLKNMGYLKRGERAKFLFSTPNLARLYLLIKVHKENFPGRAVVDQTGDPTYILCDMLTKILSPLSVNSRSYVANSSDLKEELNRIEINENCRLASLDVIGLYPNIPIEKALECIRSRLREDSTLEGRTDWSIENIMKLLEICLITYFKTIDGRIWKQTDGCPIGKSISGEIAEIYMNQFEEENIFNERFQFAPILWKRMRDDILIIWELDNDSKLNDALSIFTDKLNQVEKEFSLLWRGKLKELCLSWISV
jgi:hypothetical protein